MEIGNTDSAREADDEEELEEAIVSAAEDLWRAGPGDILVFLPGEREIRETGDLLRRGTERNGAGEYPALTLAYTVLKAYENRRAAKR